MDWLWNRILGWRAHSKIILCLQRCSCGLIRDEKPLMGYQGPAPHETWRHGMTVWRATACPHALQGWGHGIGFGGRLKDGFCEHFLGPSNSLTMSSWNGIKFRGDENEVQVLFQTMAYTQEFWSSSSRKLESKCFYLLAWFYLFISWSSFLRNLGGRELLQGCRWRLCPDWAQLPSCGKYLAMNCVASNSDDHLKINH